MGLGMARNIQKAGFQVRAWNRSRDKAERLADDGITVVDSPAEAVEGADVILTILTDGDAVLDVAEQFLDAAKDGVIWLQMSTIGHEATSECKQRADAAGLAFVDAPVLGTKKPAEEGKLVVLASGPDDAHAAVDPIFDAVGQRTMWVGQAGQGSRLKLAVNVWIVALVEGAAETLALAEGLGLDPNLVLEAVGGGPLDLPYLQLKGGMMIERSFDPSFKLALAAKDARLATQAAKEAGLHLPLLETIAERLTEGSDEHGDKDMAATFLTSTS
ncbi:MAG: 3-hydroxyisobutyrate dehydrogenase [Thermoleophilaceae bacterium]|nr:3-hydroxyisobutyrate dehydrogenase [Thermoleophilaceae bacterium]